MMKLYYFKKKLVSDGSAVMCIETDPIKDGEILQVEWVSGCHDNQTTSEVAAFYIKDGETKYDLRTLLPNLAGYPAGRRVNVKLRAGQQVGVSFPAVANTEYMYLTVIGEYIKMEGTKYRDIPSKLDRAQRDSDIKSS